MSGKRHLVFIVNPRSGTDRVKAIQSAIDERLDQERYTYELSYTERARHGVELAKAAADKGAFAVVAVGGDGSVNDVMAGLVHTKTALAIIPKGSGNGFARTVGLPLDDKGCIDIINSGRTEAVDIGYAGDRPFISNAGVGFDALISKRFTESQTRGLSTYSWLVTKHLFRYKEAEFQVTIDGERIYERAFIINVANGQQFGYNFKIAPHASYTDGLFDVVIVRRFPKLLGWRLVWRALRGDITQSPYVRHYRCKKVSVAHPDLHLMQTDGDAHPCGNHIDFRIEPGALAVLVP